MSHICDLLTTPVAPNTFANNRISLITLSTSNPGALSRIEAEDISQGAVVLYDTMTEPEYATSYDPDKAPLIYALKKKGFKGSFFDWMKQDVSRFLEIFFPFRCLFADFVVFSGREARSNKFMHHFMDRSLTFLGRTITVL